MLLVVLSSLVVVAVVQHANFVVARRMCKCDGTDASVFIETTGTYVSCLTEENGEPGTNSDFVGAMAVADDVPNPKLVLRVIYKCLTSVGGDVRFDQPPNPGSPADKLFENAKLPNLKRIAFRKLKTAHGRFSIQFNKFLTKLQIPRLETTGTEGLSPPVVTGFFVKSNPIKIVSAPKLTTTVDFVIGGNAPVDSQKQKVPSGNAFLKKVNVPKLKSISGKITINNNAALQKVILRQLTMTPVMDICTAISKIDVFIGLGWTFDVFIKAPKLCGRKKKKKDKKKKKKDKPTNLLGATSTLPACARTSECMVGWPNTPPNTPCCPPVNTTQGQQVNPFNGYWCCQWKPSHVTMTNNCGKDVKLWGQTESGISAYVVGRATEVKFEPGGGFVPALEARFTFSFITTAGNDLPPIAEEAVVLEMNPSEPPADNLIRAPSSDDPFFWWPQVIPSNFIAQKGFTDLNLDVAFWSAEGKLACDQVGGSQATSRARTQFKTSDCASLAPYALDPGFLQKTCYPACPGNPGQRMDPDPSKCPTVNQSCVITPAVCPDGKQDAPCTPVKASVFNSYAKYASENTLTCKGGKWWKSPPSVGFGYREDWKSTPMTYTLDSSATFECWGGADVSSQPGPEGFAGYCPGGFPIEGGYVTVTMCPAGEGSDMKLLKGDGTEPCDAP